MRTVAALRRAGASRAKTMGYWGMPADQRVIDFSGTAFWAVREDGKLLLNWVERSSWELFQRLNTK
jgi:hypothetical protein